MVTEKRETGEQRKQDKDTIMMESRYSKEEAQEMSTKSTAVREALPCLRWVSIRGKKPLIAH